MSGGVGGAEKGTLAVMYAGPRDGFEELKPVLSVIGKPFFIGDKPGMGQTMKLCNNLLSAAAMALSSEVMVMGTKAGLDPATMVDVINAGSGANTAVRDKFPRAVMPGTFDYGFYTGLMYKDVRLCVEEGESLGVPMPVAGAVHQMWLLANAELGPGSDFTEITKIIERWAGVEVQSEEEVNSVMAGLDPAIRRGFSEPLPASRGCPGQARAWTERGRNACPTTSTKSTPSNTATTTARRPRTTSAAIRTT